MKIIAVFSEADVNFDATQDADINSRRVGEKKKKTSKHSRRYRSDVNDEARIFEDEYCASFNQFRWQIFTHDEEEFFFRARRNEGGERHVGVVVRRDILGSTYRW